MSGRRKLSRVCSLVNTSLDPYTEFDSAKFIQKDVLIALSNLVKQIQLLQPDTDDDDDDDDVVDDDVDVDFDLSFEGSGCTVTDSSLTNVIANLLVFLSAESQFVQHSAGNVLVAVSKCAALDGDSWKCYIRSLCDCLEVAMSTILSRPLIAGAEGMKTFHALVLIKPTLVVAVANWSTVSCIIQVLRDILKYLKQDYDDDQRLIVMYLDCVSSCVSNMPLELLNDMNSRGNDDFRRFLFLGNLLQFFCSLVEQNSLTEASKEPPNSHPIVAKISNLVPKILHWCLGKLEGRNNTYLSSYFTHKLLMLMIRLIRTRISQNYSMIVTWLGLLHKYFQHLLLRSLIEHENGSENCLEGSPFASSFCNGELSSMDTRHLQRQAIFIFLRCSMCLIGFKEDTLVECACEALISSCSHYDLSLHPECCRKKKGLSEIYHWLEGHLPSNILGDCETYKKKCTQFAQSFIRLFISEDDILFEVLLQLFSIINPKQSLYKDKWTLKDVKKDILYHIANVFHPICLFRIFLAELHYDHQVLLDYLISKDTGISCAEYFLRCLRAVCNSWHLFENFSWGEKDLSGSSCKRRKLNTDAPNSRKKLFFTSVKGDVVSLSNEEHSTLCHTTKEKSTKKAKKCLLSLKSSIEKLCRKKLFPYNPEVILRRLRRFEELCLEVNNS